MQEDDPPHPQAGERVGEPLRIAVAGPVLSKPLARFLAVDAKTLPDGIGGGSPPVWQLTGDLLTRGREASVVTLDSGVSRPVIARGVLLDIDVRSVSTPSPNARLDGYEGPRHTVREGLAARSTRIASMPAGISKFGLEAVSSNVPTLVTVHDWMPAVLRLMEPSVLAVLVGPFALVLSQHWRAPDT